MRNATELFGGGGVGGKNKNQDTKNQVGFFNDEVSILRFSLKALNLLTDLSNFIPISYEVFDDICIH